MNNNYFSKITMMGLVVVFTALTSTAQIIQKYFNQSISPTVLSDPGDPTVTFMGYDLTIQQMQAVTYDDLIACNDLSYFNNTTVQFIGRVVVAPKISVPAGTVNGVYYSMVSSTTTASVSNNPAGKEIYIQAGVGTFSGMLLYVPNANATTFETTPNKLLEATAGDSVLVIGRLTTFRGMTQVEPLYFQRLFLAGSGSVPNIPVQTDGQQVEGIYPVTITSLGVFNGPGSSSPPNRLTTGEPYEGQFVELHNLQVIDEIPSSANRPVLVLADENDNRIQIGDRFTIWYYPTVRVGGRRPQIPVGSKFDYIRGIVYQGKNTPENNPACDASELSTSNFTQGYTINPFYTTHWKLGASAPSFGGVTISPVCPTSSQSVTVTAEIKAFNEGVNVSQASLYYSFDTTAFNTWSSIAMVKSGDQWSATIPSAGFADGKLVYYYIKAQDDRANPLVSLYPRVPVSIPGIALGKQKPKFFVVRDNGLQIRDVQYTPFADGLSAYAGYVVTLTGEVTASASASDAGFMAIQQEGLTEWAGIMIDPDATGYLAAVKRGWKITVVGTVEERAASSSNFTILRDIQIQNTPIPSSTTPKITPLRLNVNTFSGYYNSFQHEKYEHMLVTLVNPVSNQKLFVVDTNADYSSNFSEFRVGTDTSILYSLPANTSSSVRNTTIPGTRILSGRNANSPNTYFNSQKFSLVVKPTLNANGTINTGGPDTTALKNNGVKPVIVSTHISFDEITGIVQHSYSNMKLLPRDNNDVKGINVSLTATGANTTTGISTVLAESEVSLKPNPATSAVEISLAEGGFDVEVYDVLGVQHAHVSSVGTTVKLAVSGLSKGLYLVKVYRPGKTSAVVKRLAVE